MKIEDMKSIAQFKKLSTDSEELNDRQKDIVAVAASNVSSIPVFKARSFVGNGQITPYGAIRQYMLELNSREHQLMEVEYQLEKIELNIERTKHMLSMSTNPFDRKECEIEIKHMTRKKESFFRNIVSLREERLKYLHLIDEIHNSPYGKTEDGTPILEAMKDPIKSESLEEDYWKKRLAKQAATDLIANGRIGVGNIDSIMMLDKDSQRETLELASDLVIWNENRMTSILDKSQNRIEEKQPDLLALLEEK